MRGLLVVLAILVAGCSAAGPAAPPPGTARAFFVEPDVIEVVASDYVPVRQVELAGPLGVLAASRIDTTREPAYASAGYGPSIGLGLGAGFGGGSSASFGGIGLGFPLGGASVPSAYGGVVVSTAYIRLPELSSYAATWQRTQVRLQFGEPPDVRTLTIPAPAPGAAAS